MPGRVNKMRFKQMFCRDMHTFVTTKDVLCRDKHVFVATKMILAAAPASDTVTPFLLCLLHRFYSACYTVFTLLVTPFLLCLLHRFYSACYTVFTLLVAVVFRCLYRKLHFAYWVFVNTRVLHRSLHSLF